MANTKLPNFFGLLQDLPCPRPTVAAYRAYTYIFVSQMLTSDLFICLRANILVNFKRMICMKLLCYFFRRISLLLSFNTKYVE